MQVVASVVSNADNMFGEVRSLRRELRYGRPRRMAAARVGTVERCVDEVGVRLSWDRSLDGTVRQIGGPRAFGGAV